MRNSRPVLLRRLIALLASLLVVKVTVEAVVGYANYLPPNFSTDFLKGRDDYFWTGYQWAFYPHIAAGPVTLLLGLILVNDRFRQRFPLWHRYLGRIQVACVLLVVAPSGLWMAFYAMSGPVATLGFVILAVLTAITAAMGWRRAVQRRFAEHRCWMWRCFLLICSAVVLRVLGGLGTVLEVQATWYDPLASWSSWIVPLAVYEYTLRRKRDPAPTVVSTATPALTQP